MELINETLGIRMTMTEKEITIFDLKTGEFLYLLNEYAVKKLKEM